MTVISKTISDTDIKNRVSKISFFNAAYESSGKIQTLINQQPQTSMQVINKLYNQMPT
jgi:hypothetical protein